MKLAAADWIFIGWYFALTIGIGLYYSKRAGKSISEYFLSGRSLPWWLLGTSMVATSFSADTPLAVTGIVAKDGIAGNWLWWNFMLGGALTVLFFAHLWRRAGVVTEVEFIDLRYSGRPARFLRGFKALYLGIPVSCITFGWVTLAMVKIIRTVFGTSGLTALAICLGLTVFYTTLSGLWGVVATDMLLFGVAMAGSIVLAVVSVEKAGGIAALVEAVKAVGAGNGKDYLSVFPPLGQALPLAFFVAIFVQWWAVYYPGAEPGGGGWSAQRMLAGKDPRHAVKGTLWFNVANYVLRPWPWILTALAAIVVFPGLTAASPGEMEAAYPRMIAFVPEGRRGDHRRVALRGVHVDDRVHRQPLGLVPPQRLLPAVREEERERAALRDGVAVDWCWACRSWGPAFPTSWAASRWAGSWSWSFRRGSGSSCCCAGTGGGSTPGRRSRP